MNFYVCNKQSAAQSPCPLQTRNLVHVFAYNWSKHFYCTFTMCHGRPVCRARGGGVRAPRFCEANIKSLILTIGPPPRFILCPPSFVMCPPSFHSHRAPMPCVIITLLYIKGTRYLVVYFCYNYNNTKQSMLFTNLLFIKLHTV